MNAHSNPGPVDFDLSRGRVERRASTEGKEGQGDQVVLLPVSALAGLEKAASWEVLKQLVRTIGVSIGRRSAARLGAARGVASATLEAVVSTLASEVAVSGWGALRLERWGRAMVIVVDHAPSLPSGVLAALVEGAIEAAAAREVHGVSLSPERATATSARVLIASEKTADRARRWLIEGASETEVLGRLSSGNGGAS